MADRARERSLTLILYTVGVAARRWHAFTALANQHDGGSEFWTFRVSRLPCWRSVVASLLRLLTWPPQALDVVLLIALVLSAAWQLSWVWRYVPGAPVEVPSAERRSPHIQLHQFSDHQRISTLSRLQRTALHHRRRRPGCDPDCRDGRMVVHTTGRRLCGRAIRISLSYPLSNGYGMALFSRFELVDPIVRFVVDDAIPSIKTGILLPSGAVIDLYGLHPQPPAPQSKFKGARCGADPGRARNQALSSSGRCLGRSQRCRLVHDHLRVQGGWGLCAIQGVDEASSILILQACRDSVIPSTIFFTRVISP